MISTKIFLEFFSNAEMINDFYNLEITNDFCVQE